MATKRITTFRSKVPGKVGQLVKWVRLDWRTDLAQAERLQAQGWRVAYSGLFIVEMIKD